MDSSDYLFLLGNDLLREHRGFGFEEVVKVGDVFCVRFLDKLRHIRIDVPCILHLCPTHGTRYILPGV